MMLSLMPAASFHAQNAPQAPPPIERLRTNIEQTAKSVDTNWGIYIKCLDTNEEVSLNADKVMDTMSVIKVPLMVAAFRQIEAGIAGFPTNLIGNYIEDAIARIAEQVADYFGYK